MKTQKRLTGRNGKTELRSYKIPNDKTLHALLKAMRAGKEKIAITYVVKRDAKPPPRKRLQPTSQTVRLAAVASVAAACNCCLMCRAARFA